MPEDLTSTERWVALLQSVVRHRDGGTVVTDRTCPERPELLDGAPIGQYHCPACGCMVLAGMEHVEHDLDACWLDEIPDGEFESMVANYSKMYDPLLTSERPPPSRGLPSGCVWVWMAGAIPPHWAIRGTGLVDPSG